MNSSKEPEIHRTTRMKAEALNYRMATIRAMKSLKEMRWKRWKPTA